MLLVTKIHVSSKTSKKQIFSVALQNYVKISFSRLFKKPFLLIFTILLAIFFSGTLSKPYPSFKLKNFNLVKEFNVSSIFFAHFLIVFK